MSIEAREKMQR